MNLDVTQFKEGCVSIDMGYNNVNRAWNISIDDIIVSANVRSYFANEVASRDEIIQQHNHVINMDVGYPYDMLNATCMQTISNDYRALYIHDDNMLRMPLIFKMKGKNLKSLESYSGRHVISSMIRTYLLDGAGPLDERVDRCVYLLYYYWFFNKDSIEVICNNVIIDLEGMISLLIQKAYNKIYAGHDTNAIVAALRNQLEKERLIQASAFTSNSSKPLRLRK